MPLREYECKQCGRRTEKIQKFSDPELTECPHCGGPLERTLTAPAFHFAGGGWYKDLYSSANPAAGASSEGAGSSESKPAGGGENGGAGATPAPATAPPSAPAAAPATSSSSTPAKS